MARSQRLVIGERIALLMPLVDGYHGTGRIVSVGDKLVRFRRDDNHQEAIARRDEVRRVNVHERSA